ncbi:MAG: hypothetical protein LC096_08740 [Bacteroidia bacterium]|nr:hypothetical protein [Bacteroidia bacterium]
MEITLKATQRILYNIPTIGDKVVSISKTEVHYSNNRKISNPYIPNQNLNIGDTVTSIHIDLDENDKVVRVNIDHNKGGIFASSRESLKAEIRGLKIDQILQ